MDHTITRVTATPLKVPVGFDWAGSKHIRNNMLTYVEIETASGLIGHGMTALSPPIVVSAAINHVGGPAMIGLDATDHEHIWNVLHWALTAPGQTGIGCNALSALDIALWDIKGKLAERPIWVLLGAARRRLPAYATCGFSFFDRDNMAQAAHHMVGRGYRSLKMQVGRPGLDARENAVPLNEILDEDIARIGIWRDIAGDDVEIAMDAGARLDLDHAAELANRALDLDVGFFEEPIVENDLPAMAEMRRRSKMKIACGQSEGQVSRFRDMIAAKALDIVQPNVIVGGGYTGAAWAAQLAVNAGLPVFHGGGASYHNAHLQAGLPSGTGIEHQMSSTIASDKLFDGLPEFSEGHLVMTNTPGLGFELKDGALKEFTLR
ncbi:MAG: L-rhamnonate dehydratase [Alphaproteobacteria bacterium]|jgi:L-rhamnonate dehydratase